MLSDRIAVLGNYAKSQLLMVLLVDKGEDKLYEADQSLYQIKMALQYLNEYALAEEPKKQKIELKFRKHAGNIDQCFREGSLATDLENLRGQLQVIVNSNLRS